MNKEVKILFYLWTLQAVICCCGRQLRVGVELDATVLDILALPNRKGSMQWLQARPTASAARHTDQLVFLQQGVGVARRILLGGCERAGLHHLIETVGVCCRIEGKGGEKRKGEERGEGVGGERSEGER